MNTPNNAAALLPCPFCGSDSIDPKGWASTNSAGPACDDCGASAGNVSNNLADNIAAWNTRATLTQPDALTSQPSGEADDSAFADWIVHEMPAGTIIGSPQWWAPRIARAYRLTHPSADAPGVAVDEASEDSVVGRMNGYLYNSRAVEIVLDGPIPKWLISACPGGYVSLAAALAPKPEGGHA